MMKNKKLLILGGICIGLIMLFLLLNFCGSEWRNPSTFFKIEKGFSKELLEGLEFEYGISIPEGATFLKGGNYYTFRDSWVVLLFECPIEDEFKQAESLTVQIYELLNIAEEEYRFDGRDESLDVWWYDEYGGQLTWKLVSTKNDFTCLSYESDKSMLRIRFVGWRPGQIFP